MENSSAQGRLQVLRRPAHSGVVGTVGVPGARKVGERMSAAWERMSSAPLPGRRREASGQTGRAGSVSICRARKTPPSLQGEQSKVTEASRIQRRLCGRDAQLEIFLMHRQERSGLSLGSALSLGQRVFQFGSDPGVSTHCRREARSRLACWLAMTPLQAGS